MRNITEGYCPTCSCKVSPIKKTNWVAMILCAVFGGLIFGTIAYCVYDAVFRKADTCPNCGKKVPPMVQAPTVAVMPEPYCPNCGTRSDHDGEFCINCGQRIASDVPQIVTL